MNLAFETYVLGCAERLSAFAPATASDEAGPSWDQTAARDVARLLALAELVVNAEGAVRRAGKGQRLAALPWEFAQSHSQRGWEIEHAIFIFDWREVLARSSYLNALLEQSAVGEGTSVPDLAIARRMEGGWHEVGGGDQYGQFVATGLTFQGARSRAILSEWLSNTRAPRLSAAAVLAGALLRRVGYERGYRALIPAVRIGYVEVTRGELENAYDKVRAEVQSQSLRVPAALVPDSLDSLLTLLMAPPSGNSDSVPIVRDAGASLIIDAWALELSVHYSLMLSTERVGATQNVGALSFELQVQQRLDDVGSGLDQRTRDLRGRSLRLRGQQVTDIDALFARDEVLYLVSCKNFVRSPAYNEGDYRSVRNLRTALDSAVEDWAIKVDRFRKHFVGDNYDFRGFSRLEGLVVTPRVLYTESPMALERVTLAPGRKVFRAATVDELDGALGDEPMFDFLEEVARFMYTGHRIRGTP
jgi:hypothetical protein